MSAALDDVCKILDLADEAGSEREFLAKKIIAFAHQGQRDAALLRDRMLREIVSGRGEWPAALSAPLKAERFPGLKAKRSSLAYCWCNPHKRF